VWSPSAVGDWVAASDGGGTIAALLRREELDGTALEMATAAQLHEIGIPLGAALKIKACFPGRHSTARAGAGWQTLRVTAAAWLVVSADRVIPATTAVVIEDGGAIDIGHNATLHILGSFAAPLQHVFVGDGRVLFSGDAAGRIYPQWFGAVADGSADASPAIQRAIWAGQLPLNISFPTFMDTSVGAATVFVPPGIYSISTPVELPDHAILEGAGPYTTHLVANASANPHALISPPAHGKNRTDGWRIARLSLIGTGTNTSTNGLMLIQTSRAVISDLNINGFENGLHLNGAWNHGSDDGHGHGHGSIPCMYNAFYNLQIGQCRTAVRVNYTIAVRFHDLVIGEVSTGIHLNFTNQVDIYNPTIELFDVAIDAMYGDTAHIYNAYIGNAGKGIGIRFYANQTESSVLSPRLDHISEPIIMESETSIVLFWDSAGDPTSQCKLPPQCQHRGEQQLRASDAVLLQRKAAKERGAIFGRATLLKTDDSIFSVGEGGDIVLANGVIVVSKLGFSQPAACPEAQPYRYGSARAGFFCCATPPTSHGMDCDSTKHPCCLKPGSTNGCQDAARCATSNAAAQWLNLTAGSAADNHGWTVHVNRSGAPFRVLVTATHENVTWRLDRLVSADQHRVLIDDAFTSLSSKVQGVHVVHSAESTRPTSVVLPGALGPFDCESLLARGTFGAPHVWMSVKNGTAAVGLTPLSDQFRVHAFTRNSAVAVAPRQSASSPACVVSEPPAIELHEPYFGLRPHGTATLTWAIYPASSDSSHRPASTLSTTQVLPATNTTNYLHFVNAMRRDFGTDTITMNGTGYLSMYGAPELAVKEQHHHPALRGFNYTSDRWWQFSPDEMAAFLRDQSMMYVVSSNGGFGARDVCVTAGGNTQLDVDGSRFLIDPPEAYVAYLRSIVSQVRAARATHALQAGTGTQILHYIHSSISTGGTDRRDHGDARVLDDRGHQVFLENCHSVPRCNTSLCDYPLFYATLGNTYQSVLREYVDKALDLGFTGLYHDEFGASDVMFTYGDPGDWDNASVVMDSVTKQVIATPSSLWLLTQEAQISLFRHIVSRGGSMIANGAPPTLGWFSLRPASLHFAENSMAHRALAVQIYTPIMLSKPSFQGGDTDPKYNTP
jgi:hypothetical protein